MADFGEDGSGLEVVLEAAADAVGEGGLGTAELSSVVAVRAGGVLVVSAGGVVVADGKRDAGFCALWQELLPRTRATESAIKA